MLDGLDEQAFSRLARHQCRTGIAALAQARAEIHAQPALLFFRAVTLVTIIGEKRTDVLLEKLDMSGRELVGRIPGEAVVSQAGDNK